MFTSGPLQDFSGTEPGSGNRLKEMKERGDLYMSLLKKIGVVATTFAVAIGFAACGDKVTISAENKEGHESNLEKEYIIATNTLVVPYTFKNYLDEYIGIDVDLLEAIAENQGFTYQLVPMAFDDVLHALDTGEVDGAMAGISITNERKKRYDYSEPYLQGGVVMGTAAVSFHKE